MPARALSRWIASPLSTAGMVCVLALGFLLPTLLGKERRKIDPRLNSVYTIFVQGRDDRSVRTARASLKTGRCFELAPNAESADALMTVLWLSENQAVHLPSFGPWDLSYEKWNRSTVIIKIREQGKLRKVWGDRIVLEDPEEARKSGVRRLIEELNQDVCPELRQVVSNSVAGGVSAINHPVEIPPTPVPEAPELAPLPTPRAAGATLLQAHEPRALTYAPDVSSVVTWPLSELLKAIPELKGLEATESQDELPAILQKVGENVKAYFGNFPNTASVEGITTARLGRVLSDSEGGAQKFQYLALAHSLKGCTGLDEYRTDTKGVHVKARGLAGSYFITQGFVSTPLHFHASCQDHSTFRYLGRQVIDKRETNVVAFAQRPRSSPPPIQIDLEEISILALVQGIAWIDSRTYQILRMRTDLLPPNEEFAPARVTTKIEFQVVHFKESGQTLCLPREVVVSTDWRGYTYLNKHHYSNFRLFVVETEEKIKAPHDAPSD